MTVTGVTSLDPAAVRAALHRAQEVLWRTQRPDGSWESLCDMGAIPTAQVLVAVHAAGALAPADAADGARWLRTRPQEADGSYRSHPTATEGDLGATASAWAALSLCAPEASGDAIARARAWSMPMAVPRRWSRRSAAAIRRWCTSRSPDWSSPPSSPARRWCRR